MMVGNDGRKEGKRERSKEETKGMRIMKERGKRKRKEE